MNNSYQQNNNAGSGWNRPQNLPPQQSPTPHKPQYSLSYMERSTIELAKNNAVVDNLANATMEKANEMMAEIKKAGLLTQSIKDGKTYVNKMMVKIEPAIKYDTREPYLHADGSPVYKATIRLSVNNSTLQMTAQETASKETQIIYMGAFANRQYYKQNDIENSPCDDNIKAVAKLVKDKFLVERSQNQKSYQQAPQQPTSRQYQNNAPQRTASSQQAQQQSSWYKQQSPAPSDKPSLETFRRKMNAYFTVHSEAVLNKENELVNNAYAQLKKDKFGNERIYILNHTDTIVVEMGLKRDGSPYARALDWHLTDKGLPRNPNDVAPPASFPLNNEIDIHNYVNLNEIKSVIGNYLSIEVHLPKTFEEIFATKKGDYEWIKDRIEAEGNSEGKKGSTLSTPDR